MGMMFPSLKTSKGTFVPAVPEEAPTPQKTASQTQPGALPELLQVFPDTLCGCWASPLPRPLSSPPRHDPAASRASLCAAMPELFLDDAKPCSSK